MKTLLILLVLSISSSFASTSAEDTAKVFGSIMFKDNSKSENLKTSHIDVQIESALTDEIQVAHISYTDASDHYYAIIEIKKDKNQTYYVSSCSTPDYVVEWKNGEACRQLKEL